MGVNYWTGDVDGDVQDNGNWSGVIPVAGDELVFDGRSAVAVTEGILPSETGNIAFDLIHIRSSFTPDIGTTAEPLAIGTAAGNEITIIHEGTGDLHLMCSLNVDATGNNAVIPRVIVNSVGGTVYLYSLDNDGANTSTFSDVYFFQGTLALATEAHGSITGDETGPVVTNLYLHPKGNKGSKITGTAVINSYKVNGPSYTNIYMRNGTFTTDSGMGIVHIADGTLNLGTDGGGGTNVDIATDLIMAGGTLNWNPDETNAYINKGHIFGGTIACSLTINEDSTRVIGNGANLNLYVYDGAALNLATGQGTVSVNASSKIINLGGIITLDSVSVPAIVYNPDLGS